MERREGRRRGGVEGGREELREDGGGGDRERCVGFGRCRLARIGEDDGRRCGGAAGRCCRAMRCWCSGEEDLVVLVEEDERVQLETLDELKGVERVAACAKGWASGLLEL